MGAYWHRFCKVLNMPLLYVMFLRKQVKNGTAYIEHGYLILKSVEGRRADRGDIGYYRS